MPKDFKPPQQVESHSYVFDRKTGEILATHTRWTDAGAETAQEDVSQELLAGIAEDSARAAKDLDVLQAKPRAGRGMLRVDVTNRKVIVDTSAEKKNILMTPPPRRP